MDLPRAFTYPFEDEEWTNKLPITLILGVIPIVNLTVLGWALDLIRNMLAGSPRPMPAWDGETLVDRFVAGLTAAVAMILHYLPIIVIICPLAILQGVLAAGSGGGLINTAFDLCIRLVTLLYTAAVWLPLAVGVIRFARTRDFNVFLQIGQNLSLANQHFATFIVLALYMFAASLVISLLGLIPCVGWLLTLLAFSVNLVIQAHLIGQAGVDVMNRTQRGAA